MGNRQTSIFCFSTLEFDSELHLLNSPINGKSNPTSVPWLIRQPAKYIFYEIIASSRRRTNNFNENSGVEFRGKSDISCYVQSNASLPRRDNASPHTLCNSGSRHSEAMLLLLSRLSRYMCTRSMQGVSELRTMNQ